MDILGVAEQQDDWYCSWGMYSFHCRGVLRHARVALAAADLDPPPTAPFSRILAAPP
jgi:hypothetical protein